MIECKPNSYDGCNKVQKCDVSFYLKRNINTLDSKYDYLIGDNDEEVYIEWQIIKDDSYYKYDSVTLTLPYQEPIETEEESVLDELDTVGFLGIFAGAALLAAIACLFQKNFVCGKGEEKQDQGKIIHVISPIP